MTMTPVSQIMSLLDVQPPPLVRSPRFIYNTERDNIILSRRWADYSDDEPLPSVVFGIKMKPIEVNLLSQFNEAEDGDLWTTVLRNNVRRKKR